MKKLLAFLSLAFVATVHADSKTPRLGLTIPTIGSPTWGQKVNGNFQILDATGVGAGAMTVSQNQVIVCTNAFHLDFTGSGVSVTLLSATTAEITITGGGGGGGTGTSNPSYGSIITSQGHVQQTGITLTPVKLSGFSSNGDSLNSVPNASSAQIQVSTTAAFWVGMNILSTGTGTSNFFLEIRKNGSSISPPISCQDTPSIRCVAYGVVNLSSGDIITTYINSNSAAQSTITVTDAQLVVMSVGGSGSGGGGGSGTPAGSNTNVQFNDGGSFGGNSGFQYDKSVSSISIVGAAKIGKLLTGTTFYFSSGTVQGPLYVTGVDNNSALTISYPLGNSSFNALTIYNTSAKATNNSISIPYFFRDGNSNLNEFSEEFITSEGITAGSEFSTVEWDSMSGGSVAGNIKFGGDAVGKRYFGLMSNNPLRFYDSGTGNYQALKTVTNLGATNTWILPSSDSNGCWQSDGAGNLSIASCGSGGSRISTITASVNIVVANSTGPNVIVSVSSSPTFSGPVTLSSTTNGFFSLVFDAAQSKLPGVNSPYISNSTGETSASVYFDDTSTQSCTWTGLVQNYDGRTLYADIIFTSTATSGTVNWGIYTDTETPNIGQDNYDSPVYSVIVTTSVTMNSVSNSLQKATVTLSNTTTANGQFVTFKLEREAQSLDTAVGFGRVKKLRIYE